MSKTSVAVLLFALAGVAQAYSIKYSYSGAQGSTEFYGACDDGQMLKIVKYPDGKHTWEGPAGTGVATGQRALDQAASAACGE